MKPSERDNNGMVWLEADLGPMPDEGRGEKISLTNRV